MPSDTDSLSLLFIGDIMGHDEQIWSAENRKTKAYNFDDVFVHIKPEISEADVSIANFEVTLAGPPYKGYPRFSSPADLAAACSNAGIDYLVTANNHSADRGRNGIEKTIFRLDSMGIFHTGTFLNAKNRDTLSPLIINKNGFKIALLNYTYGTNGLDVPGPVIVNLIDTNQVSNDIKKAKQISPDLIILFLHWGTEYDTIPSVGQIALTEYFLTKGVNFIIGSHPHVLQKMVRIEGSNCLVAYSLGNFISNQQKRKTDGGSMIRIELIKNESGEVKIKNAGYYLTWVYTPIENYRKKFFIIPCSKYEQNPGFFDKPSAFLKMKTFLGDSRALLNLQNVNIKEHIFSENGWQLKY
jgi:poly-gamma-glutamate synthesis protein (capsule biosynthesis protein)